MKRILLSIVLVLALAVPGWTATWYVRPLAASGYTTNDGTTYASAFSGFHHSADFAPADVVTGANGYVQTQSPVDIQFWTENLVVWFTTTGTLPGGLSPNTRYYVSREWYAGGGLKTTTGGSRINLTNGGSGVHTIHIGIDWTLITAGDTLYVCDNFGYDERNIQYHLTSVESANLAGIRTLNVTKRVIVRGDYAGHPGYICPTDKLFAGASTWTATGTNGVWYAAPSTTENAIVFQDKKLCNLYGFKTLTTPTTDELNAFNPGDYGTVTIGGMPRIYFKSRADCPADPNSSVITTGYSGWKSIEVSTAASGTQIWNLIVNGGIVDLNNVTDCVVDGNTITGAYVGIELDGTCTNPIIRNNTISKCGVGGIYAFYEAGQKYSSNSDIHDNNISYIGMDETSDLNLLGLINYDRHCIGWMGGTGLKFYRNIGYFAGTFITLYTDGNADGVGTNNAPLTAEVYGNFGSHFRSFGDGLHGNGSYMGAGIDYDGGPPSSGSVDINFHSNIVLDAGRSGYRITPHYSNTGVKVCNNVAYHCANSYEVSSSVGLRYILENNISLSPQQVDTSPGNHVWFISNTYTNCAITSDYNCFYPNTGTPFNWEGTGQDFDGYKSSLTVSNTLVSPTNMTGYTTGDWTVSASYDVNGPAWQAFDSDVLHNGWWTAYGAVPWSIELDYAGTAYTATSYKIAIPDYAVNSTWSPQAWTLQGYNGSTWDTIDTRTSQTDWTALSHSYTIASPGAYQKYKLVITTGNNTTILVNIFLYVGPMPELHSLTSDPAFLNAGGSFLQATDFKPGDASPCRAGGYAWTGIGLATDMAGNKFKSPPSIGAYQFYKIGGVLNPGKVGGVSHYKF